MNVPDLARRRTGLRVPARRARAAAAAALFALAGCAAPLGIPEGYRGRVYDAPGAALGPEIEDEPEPPRDAAPLENLDLARAIEMALLRNHTTAAASAAVEAAIARIAEARAAFLPTLSGSVTRSWNTEASRITTSTGASIQVSPFQITRAEAQLALSLFAFGRDEAALRAAQAAAATEVLGERVARQELVFQVTEAWFRLHEAASNEGVAADALSAAARQLEDAINIFNAGRATKDAELTARVNWLESQQDLTVARNAVTHARRVLNTLLAREVDAPLALAESPPFAKIDLPVERLRDLARRHSPEILAFRTRRTTLDQERESVERSFAPELIGSLSAEYSDFKGFTGFSTNYVASLGVTWEPVNGGRRIGRLQELQAEIMRLREQELQFHLDLDLAIERVALDVAEQESAYEVAVQAVESATENYRIISERFRNGRATSREVLDAQVTLSDSRNSLNLARFAHRVLTARIERLVGVARDDWREAAP